MRKAILPTVIIASIALVLPWVASHGVIKVAISGDASADIVIRDHAGKIIKQKTAKNLSATLGTGEYTLYTRINDKATHVENISIKRFLIATKASPTSMSEPSRAFFGNSPLPCIATTSTVAFSYDCSGTLSSIVQHVGADANTPTYTQKITTENNDQIEASAQIANQTFIFTAQSISKQSSGGHYISTLNNKGIIGSPTLLQGLNAATRYSFSRSGNGYIAVGSDGTLMLSKTIDAKPSQISVDKVPKDQKLKGASSDGATLVIWYSTTPAQDNNEDPSLNAKTTVYSYNIESHATTHFSSNLALLEASPCGKGQICILDASKTFKIMDTSGKQHMAIANAKELVQDGAVVLIGLDGMVARVNNGTLDSIYTTDNQTCGLHVENSVPILCTGVAGNNTALLRFDTTKALNGTPDEKVLDTLSKIDNLSDLSMYGRFIYGNVAAGDVVYVPSLRTYGYDPATLDRNKKEVLQKIKDAKIDTSKYSVTLD